MLTQSSLGTYLCFSIHTLNSYSNLFSCVCINFQCKGSICSLVLRELCVLCPVWFCGVADSFFRETRERFNLWNGWWLISHAWLRLDCCKELVLLGYTTWLYWRWNKCNEERWDGRRASCQRISDKFSGITSILCHCQARGRPKKFADDCVADMFENIYTEIFSCSLYCNY